ncbi:MAG TPA: response regulator transcription factor [Vicinamibacteria bacterium]|nr:response regulator transcription factor [Vicinamibacteria bacterium]
MAQIRVAIASDTQLFAEGLARILAGQEGITLLPGWRPEPTSAAPARGHPDILVADARMEGALALCAAVHRRGCRPRPILVGIESDGGRALQALEAGVRGLLGRASSSMDLLKAIRVVHEGQVWAGSATIAHGLDELASLRETTRPAESALAALSPRERQVARYAATGLTNKDIAARLDISEGTVKAHLSRVFERLGVRGRAELAAHYHHLAADTPGDTR